MDSYFHNIELRQGSRSTEVYLDGKRIKGAMSVDRLEFFEDYDVIQLTIKANVSMTRLNGGSINKFTNMRDS